jgi:hypothetical protein
MLKQSQLALVLALIAAVSAWCFLDFVLIPHQVADAAKTGLPRGNLSDLYPRWLGARQLLLRGRDPYSADVTREIQAGYYGRPIDPSRPGDPKDQQAFAYPLYVVFLLAPTVHLPFPVVQRVFGWLLVLLTAVSIPFWLRALRWRLPLLVVVTWMVAALGSFPAIQGLKLQQLSLLVCVLLAACIAALASGFPVLAGILLALATIKPQLAGILAAWLVLWALSDWRRRQRLLWSFGLSMLVLVVAAEILLPGWIGRFRAAASAYWQYTGGGKSVLDVAMGTVLGKAVAALILVALAAFCWRLRREPADSPTFAWAFCSVLAVTLVVIPTYALYNQLLLLPVLMLVLRSAPSLWEKGRLQRFFGIITALCVLWPWLTAAILDLALLVLPGPVVQQAWAVPLGPSLAVPVTVLGMLAVSANMALATREPSPASSRR